MKNAAGHILKGDTVNLQGSFQLDMEQIAPGPTKNKNVTSCVPQARIVENHPQFAVIEVTCCCGAKTHIRCEYATVESTDQESDKSTINGENNNAS